MKLICLCMICMLMGNREICFAQAKKPTLMVVPSDVWCNQNGFMINMNNQGTDVSVPDYKKAFQNSPELLQVISKINGLMADRGFPLKNMESAIKTLEAESAEDAIRTSKSGSGIVETPIEKLKKVAKADIIIQVTWTVNTNGPNRTISFVLQGIDAYTDKQIAEAGATSAPSFSADVPTLLGESVVAHLDPFNKSLEEHFKDMFAKGREIVVRIKKFATWDGELDKEYNGKELSSCIEDWIRSNTVNSAFNLADVEDNMMLFEQVRMPLSDAKNNALDARGFLKGLQKHLSDPPYNIVNKLVIKGLGQATIILGEK